MTDLEAFRRGFIIGDRVRVEMDTRGGTSIRSGVIRAWRWGGRSWGENKLPDLYLCADVEFKKRDGTGTYQREFNVERLFS